MQDAIVCVLGNWAGELNTGSIALRILLSLVLSSIIGCERSSKRHSAGLRTFMIVSLASTIAAMIETEALLRDPDTKRYTVEEALKELKA